MLNDAFFEIKLFVRNKLLIQYCLFSNKLLIQYCLFSNKLLIKNCLFSNNLLIQYCLFSNESLDLHNLQRLYLLLDEEPVCEDNLQVRKQY